MTQVTNDTNKELSFNQNNNQTVERFSDDSMDLNLQPSASIFKVFSRLSYKPWYAIAEFVDNSTQSFFSHVNELSKIPHFSKLIISINYDEEANTITIKDNAYGMEIERFCDAIILNSRNESQVGRNEFGMGLKTAASWFGNVWKVISTQLGSKYQYSATVDIPKLEEHNLQGTKIQRRTVDINSHGTVIIISQITKRINAPRTIGKIREQLSSTYRRDINNNNIEILFNGEPIFFHEYPVLKNYEGKSWKKCLNFNFEFDDKSYGVSGFVAIMDPGSYQKAGFALFRHDRVVIGGKDCNYKPYQIFKQAQSQISLKLFGELNVNDFPVNQAKDGFIWDDGLEDAFIEALKTNIQEYILIAEKSKKERAPTDLFTNDASDELQKSVSNTIDNAFNSSDATDLEKHFRNNNQSSANSEFKQTQINQNTDNNDPQDYTETNLSSTDNSEIVSSARNYTIPFKPSNVHITIQWIRSGNKIWIDYRMLDDNNYEAFINIDHAFFMPYTKSDEDFKRILEKFAIAFILSERTAKLSSDREGYIQTHTIKNFMNQYLKVLAEEE